MNLEAEFKPYLERIAGKSDLHFSVVKMTGDASNREYFRVRLENTNPESLVVMRFRPENAFRSDEVSAGAPTRFPFLDVRDWLERQGLPVPAVYEHDIPQGLVFLEDLGETLLYHQVQAPDRERRRQGYRQAVELLVAFQAAARKGMDTSCIAFSREFTYELLMWECDHYLEYGITVLKDLKIGDDDLSAFHQDFGRICRELRQGEQILAHRDFQSRNLMLRDGKLTLIDFQDALMGSVAYDLVALLRDSYIVLDDALVDELIEHYLETDARRTGVRRDGATFRRIFDLQTVQRKLKDSGRFVFIDRVKGNSWFLPFIPDSLGYVRSALGRLPDYRGLADRLARYEERLAL